MCFTQLLDRSHFRFVSFFLSGHYKKNWTFLCELFMHSLLCYEVGPWGFRHDQVLLWGLWGFLVPSTHLCSQDYGIQKIAEASGSGLFIVSSQDSLVPDTTVTMEKPQHQKNRMPNTCAEFTHYHSGKKPAHYRNILPLMFWPLQPLWSLSSSWCEDDRF